MVNDLLKGYFPETIKRILTSCYFSLRKNVTFRQKFIVALKTQIFALENFKGICCIFFVFETFNDHYFGIELFQKLWTKICQIFLQHIFHKVMFLTLIEKKIIHLNNLFASPTTSSPIISKIKILFSFFEKLLIEK